MPWWLRLHLANLAIFPLLGLAAYLLVRDVRNRAAAWSRVAIAVYVPLYAGFDALVGVGTGVLVQNASLLDPASRAVAEPLIDAYWGSGVLFALAAAGSIAWVIAMLSAAVAHTRPERRRLAASVAIATFPVGGWAETNLFLPSRGHVPLSWWLVTAGIGAAIFLASRAAAPTLLALAGSLFGAAHNPPTGPLGWPASWRRRSCSSSSAGRRRSRRRANGRGSGPASVPGEGPRGSGSCFLLSRALRAWRGEPGMKILVTGATGVIGRRLVPLLAGAGHLVAAAARSARSREFLASLGATPVEADLFSPSSLRRAVAGCSAVVNLATHMPSSSARMFLPGAWLENDRVRREGSANLADAALAEGVGRFLQESFAPVYPDCGDRWIEEDIPLRPVSYNRTIEDAERSAAQVTRAGGAGVVLRFGAFYGPDSPFLLEMIRLVRHGWAPLPGDPLGFVSSVSHDDAATAAAAALAVPPGIYNVVDDEPVTRRELVDSLARALAVAPPKLPPRWATFLLGSLGTLLARSLRISNRKLRSASSWAPRYRSVREGWPAVVAEIRKGLAPAVD